MIVFAEVSHIIVNNWNLILGVFMNRSRGKIRNDTKQLVGYFETAVFGKDFDEVYGRNLQWPV
jgi:hypothetical protein